MNPEPYNHCHFQSEWSEQDLRPSHAASDSQHRGSHSGFVLTGCPKEQGCCVGKGVFKFPKESCLSSPSNVCCALHFIFLLFSGIDHVSIRLDLETLFQFSHLILTFKVLHAHLLPELSCNLYTNCLTTRIIA